MDKQQHALHYEWDLSEANLANLRREVFEFYEAHSLADIKVKPELQEWLRKWRATCVKVHYQRMDLVMAGLKLEQ